MIESSAASMRSRRWELGIATAAGAGVMGAVAFAIGVALPPTIVNLERVTSNGRSPYVLEVSEDTAEVTLPAGWVVERKDAAELLVWTPDGRMSATMTLTQDARLTALEEAVEGDATLQTEILASGFTVTHADRQSPHGVVAAVSLADGGASTLTLLVTTTIVDHVDPRKYDLALAELLEGVG